MDARVDRVTSPIYLDHNATTPVLPEVFDAMLPYLREHFGNPSSGHVYGRRTADAIARAREQVAALLGCDADEIVFTSGGTESNNLALRGVIEAAGVPRARIVTSAIEHPAVAQPCHWLAAHGHDVVKVGVDANGRAYEEQGRSAITAGTTLVSLMHSHNETGVLQPVRAFASFAHEVGAVMHTDAAQSVGKVPVHVRELDVDLLTIAGHKLYAPKGVGALYVRRGTTLAPFVRGADHEHGLRPGTENVAFIVGLGVACDVAARTLADESPRQERLRDTLWGHLAGAIPGITLTGAAHARLPNTLHVRFPRASGNAILAGAPEVAASTGSACHSGNEVASDAILALGISPSEALGAVRLSLGRGTTEDDVRLAGDALVRSWLACTQP
jgi:cysteine desulfurase